MKKLLLLLLIIASTWAVQGCFPPPTTSNQKSNHYEYEIGLVGTSKGDSANIFHDEFIGAGFVFNNKALSFIIKNKTDSPIKIKWDESSLVIFGEASKVIHSGVRFLDAGNPQSPTVIPPLSMVSEIAAPVSKIRYAQGQYGGWRQDAIFVDYDYGKKENEDLALSLKGAKISFYMPVLIKDQQKDYNFQFEIVKVVRK